MVADTLAAEIASSSEAGYIAYVIDEAHVPICKLAVNPDKIRQM